MADGTYPLSPQGVFYTLNGEGYFTGVPQVFIRLAGCPVGCAECDTDYTVARRASPRKIAEEAVGVGGVAEWIWITGGEPTIHDLLPLANELRRTGFKIALATSGVNRVLDGCADFVSVSPHKIDSTWVQRTGDQLNIVPGLNGLQITDMVGINVSGFPLRYVTPCDGKPQTQSECVRWVDTNTGWRLGIQAHKQWKIA